MNDLEAIAEIVTEAAIKAAKKITEPLEQKVHSLGRSIDSSQVMNRKAVEDAQSSLDFTKECHAQQATNYEELKAKFYASIQSNSTLFKELLAKGKDLEEIMDSLPEYVKKEISDIHVEYDSSFNDIRNALKNLEKVYEQQSEMLKIEKASRDEEFERQLKSLNDLAEEKIGEIKEESKGETGPPGPPGPPGEIGNMQTPTPWTEKRLYKSGESVIHRGGTWFCAASTAEEPGLTPNWTLLANGVDAKSCYEENGVATIVYADGGRFQYRVQPRRMGVWKSDERYMEGDLVTYNYSQYRALVDGPTQIPGKKIPDGQSPEWHTEVGRGQKGPRGLPGDPQDAAVIVYAQIQKDIAESQVLMDEYLQKVMP